MLIIIDESSTASFQEIFTSFSSDTIKLFRTNPLRVNVMSIRVDIVTVVEPPSRYSVDGKVTFRC